MPFTIVCDSAANLPSRQLARYGIVSVPLRYTLDGVTHDCPPPDQYGASSFFQALRDGASTQTSLVSAGRFIEYFDVLMASGRDVLCLTVSSGVSGTYQAACLAAMEMRSRYPNREIFIIDSKAAGLGEGLLALYAAQLKEQGYSLSATMNRVERKLQTLEQIFTVEDLEFLRRSGRINSLTTKIGTLLQLRPLLHGVDGKIAALGKARGRKAAIQALADQYGQKARFGGAVAISHADCAADAAALEQAIRALDPEVRILTVPWEPVTGSHCGPGALAVFFFGNNK